MSARSRRSNKTGECRSSRRTEKVRPGMSPRFLSQKMDANEPEKKMPSTAAKATRRSPKTERSSEIHRSAQSAFLAMQGTAKEGGRRGTSASQ